MNESEFIWMERGEEKLSNHPLKIISAVKSFGPVELSFIEHMQRKKTLTNELHYYFFLEITWKQNYLLS